MTRTSNTKPSLGTEAVKADQQPRHFNDANDARKRSRKTSWRTGRRFGRRRSRHGSRLFDDTPSSFYHRKDEADLESALEPHDGIGAFATVEGRHAFIRKVYGIVLAQLTLTFGLLALGLFIPPVRALFHTGMFAIAALVGGFCALGALIALACGPREWRTRWPTNIILLCLFTVGESLLICVGVVQAEYGHVTVGIAFGVTILIVVSFTIFACQTRFDITKHAGIIFLILIAFYILSIAWAIVASLVAMNNVTFNIIELAVASFGVLLFVALLVYHTQMILGGKKYAYAEDDYVLAAIVIYLDIVNIFMYLLRILRAMQRLN